MELPGQQLLTMISGVKQTVKHWLSRDISQSPGYRVAITLVTAFLLVQLRAFDADCRNAVPPDVQGIYVSQDSLSTLEVRREESRYLVLLSGGSPGKEGAGAPADCYVKAAGNLKETVLVAFFQPLETDTFSYGKVRANRENRKIKVIFGFGTADVITADTFGYCGLGVSFLGKYLRK